MMNENNIFYIHFENMPPYELLDQLFEIVESKTKIFATSYQFEVSKSKPSSEVVKLSRRIFMRQAYFICQVKKSSDIFGETDFSQ